MATVTPRQRQRRFLRRRQRIRMPPRPRLIQRPRRAPRPRQLALPRSRPSRRQLRPRPKRQIKSKAGWGPERSGHVGVKIQPERLGYGLIGDGALMNVHGTRQARILVRGAR
jgi:hypothetical protein